MGNVTSFHVTGDWRHIIDDGMVDVDALPDEALPTGHVIFTPLSPKIAVAGSPAVAHTLGKVSALIAGGELTDLQGREGVWLAGKIGDQTVRWRAVTHLLYKGQKIAYPVLEFDLVDDAVLTGLIQNSEPGQPPIVVDPRIEALVREAQDSLDQTRTMLSEATEYHENVEQWHGEIMPAAAQVAEDRQIAHDASALAVLAASQAGRIFGEGDPEGEQDAPIGTLYVDTDTGVMWHKATQEGNPNGWTLLETGDGAVIAAAEHAADAAAAAESALGLATVQDGSVRDLVTSASLTRTALNTAYVREDSRLVHVKTFGAKGDGTTDDTAAIQSALNADVPLYWGTSKEVYRTTADIVRSTSKSVNWVSDGAAIKCDAPSPIRRALYLGVSGASVSIKGPLVIDGQKKAFIGFCLDSLGTKVQAEITGLAVRNIYRSSTAHVGGDGILIRGSFTTVVLNMPMVESVTMPAGVESGEDGVAGISVCAFDAERQPLDVQINAPFVDGVYDEDSANIEAQNGIRIYGASDAEGITKPREMKFQLTGGTIRNCGGRSIKVKCEWGVVTGVKLYRGLSRARGKADIDFQTGGGLITDVTAHYDGSSVSEVVKFSGTDTAGKLVPSGFISGLQVLNSSGQAPNTIVSYLQGAAASASVSLRAVEVVGTQAPYVLTVNGASGTSAFASLDGVFAAPTSALVRATGGSPNGWKGAVVGSCCTNTGANTVPFYLSTSGDYPAPKVSASAMSKFSDPSLDPRAVVGTVAATTSGWNDLKIVSGYGTIPSPSRFRPGAGTYRVTYLRSSPVTRGGSAGTKTITPADGSASEVLTFAAADYLMIQGSMTDLLVTFERLV